MTCETNTCGTGGWTGPLPGDPDNNLILSASPAFGGIDVTWTYPGINPEAVAYVKLYRGLTSDFNGAIEIALVAGNFFYDKTTSEILRTQYYWIRVVSVNGTIGDLIGPASAVAKPTISGMLELLTGQINSGMLAQSLSSQIDQIGLNAQAITQEQTSRVSANEAYSALMTQVQAGIDGAYSLINQQYIAQQTANSSLATAINTAQSVLNGNIASVQQTFQTNINTLDGKVTGIGALYNVKVNVNGLVGGFGVYNDGTTIEAGFDVNTFWVGSSQGNKVKPFIISNGTTFINDAVIEKLTFTKLRDTSGALVFENGKLKADYVSVTQITNGSFTGYAWPSSGSGFYLGPGGLLMGRYIPGGGVTYFQFDTATGTLNMPGLTIVNGNATFSGTLSGATGSFSGTLAAGTVNTNNIVGNALNTTYVGTSASASVSKVVTVPAGASSVVIMVGLGSGIVYGGGESYTYVPVTGSLNINTLGDVVTGSNSAIVYAVENPAAGTYTVTATRSNYSSSMQLVVLVNKR